MLEHYAIVQDMERFLLELGAGFAFVARQKRMTTDNENFYIDLGNSPVAYRDAANWKVRFWGLRNLHE